MTEQVVSRFANLVGPSRHGFGNARQAADYGALYGPAAGFDTWYIVDAADVRYGAQDGTITASANGGPINTVGVLFARNSADHSKDAVFFCGGNSDAMGPLAKIGPNHTARTGECEWSTYVETLAGHALTTPDGKVLARKLLAHIKDNAHPYGDDSVAEIVVLTVADAYAQWPMLAPVATPVEPVKGKPQS